MTFKINKITVVAVIIAVCGLFYVVGRYNYRQSSKKVTEALISARDSIKTYKVTLGGVLKEVNEISQLVVTERQAKELALIEKEKYRKLHLKSISEVTLLQGRISILLDSIKNNAQVIIVTDIDSAQTPCAKLPFSFAQKNKFIDLSGTFNEKAIMSMKLEVPVSLDVTVGVRKKGLPTVIVLSNNPYFKLDKISSIKVTQEKHWYDSHWLYLGVGFTGGVVLAHYIK